MKDNSEEKSSSKSPLGKGRWIFRFFHPDGNREEDAAAEDQTPTLRRFFRLLRRKFWRLITLNMMMLPMIAPILIGAFVYLSMKTTPTANNPIFSQLYGAGLITSSTDTTFLLDLFGAQALIPAFDNTASYVGIGICAAFLVLTFGWQNIGATYILRGIVRGDPVFPFSDYIYAVKRNWKQGFFLGLIDAAVLFFLGFDFLFFYNQTGSFKMDVMYFAIFAISILYFVMRFYIYQLQITFNLSIRKILKNALIFAVLGVKRNLMAILGIVVLTAIAIAFIALFAALLGGNIAIPLILPFLYYLAFTAFMAAYAAYPIIDRYMIAPYIHQDSDSGEDGDADEASETDGVAD